MIQTAWMLCVVSSDGQSDTLEFQERWGHEVADVNGWKLERVFRDVSTGKHGVRRLLSELIDELKRLPKVQRPARLLMVRLDRMGRGDGLETIAALSEIKKLGPVLHTREDGDVRLERAADSLMPMLKSVLAGMENEVRADKTRAGCARRRAKGLHAGNAPYGAILVDGKAVTYEPEAALVRELFTLRKEGWGYDRLARYASQHAIPKKLLGDNTRTLKWGRSTVQRLLWCITLRGTVIEPKLFDDVQGARGLAFRARRIQTWDFPLAHVIRCTCGMMLSGQCSGRPGNRTRYYVCRGVATHGWYPHHNAEDIERQFQALLSRVNATPGTFATNVGTNGLPALRSRESALKGELVSLDRREARVWEIAEAGNIPPTTLRVRLERIADDRERYESELQGLAREIGMAERVEEWTVSLEEVFRALERCWTQMRLDDQQRCAKAIASTPAARGLWLAPATRGRGRRRIQSELTFGTDLTGDAKIRHSLENMREIDTLRNVDMAQRKADDSITKKFIQSIGE
jgi:DNA invertase Pin-like site-specific DNA recombinase